MYFCPFCNNFLIPEQQQSLFLACTTCPYIYRLNTIQTQIQKNKVKEIDKIAGEEDDIKYANKCQIKCLKCPNDEALFVEIQTRSADEPMTIFYQCTKCHYNWKD